MRRIDGRVIPYNQSMPASRIALSKAVPKADKRGLEASICVCCCRASAAHGRAEWDRAGQNRAGGAYCCLRRVRLWWVMVWLAFRRCRSWARRLFSACRSTSSVCQPTQRRCSWRPSSPLPWISLVRLFTTASRGPATDPCCVQSHY